MGVVLGMTVKVMMMLVKAGVADVVVHSRYDDGGGGDGGSGGYDTNGKAKSRYGTGRVG